MQSDNERRLLLALSDLDAARAKLRNTQVDGQSPLTEAPEIAIGKIGGEPMTRYLITFQRHDKVYRWERFAETFEQAVKSAECALGREFPDGAFKLYSVHAMEAIFDQKPQAFRYRELPSGAVTAEAILNTAAVAYMCPLGCGCLWRDNGDGTMSLFGINSKSCAACEVMPLAKLIPLKRVTATKAQPEGAEWKPDSMPANAAPFLGTCETPHFLQGLTEDRRALLQIPHYALPRGRCKNWQPCSTLRNVEETK